MTGAASAIIFAVAGTATTPAHATWPDTSAFSASRELSDGEMSGMRGRFVGDGTIMFFGVSMTSNWRTSTGEVLHAQADLQADMRNSQPKVSFQPHVTAMSIADYQAAQQSGNGGTSVRNGASTNGNGVMQVIQIGGDNNAVANRLEIEVTDKSNGGITTALAGGQSQLSTQSGANIAVQNQPGRIGININVPGQGQISQQVIANRGLQQSVQLNSSLQQVSNVTRLQVQIRPQSGTNINQMRNALTSLRDLNGHIRL